MRPPDALDVMLTVEQLWQPVPGGSGTYIRALVEALDARDDVTVTGLAARHGDTTARLGPDVAVHHSRLDRRALYALWSRSRAPWTATASLGGARPDVLHATTWAVPPRVAPLVVTVHDLAFLRDPGHFTAHGNRYFRRGLQVVRDEADLVVVPSEVTAADCVDQGIEAERVRVIPHGVSVPAVTPTDIAAFRRAHGLTRPYVMWAGTLEPRKNVPALLAAFGELARTRDDVDLVLAGPVGWGTTATEAARALSELPAGRVHLVGRLTDTDLHAAYAGAGAFCFPSTWEGFGLPVLEAMAHGVPVVTSRATSMAEVAGTAALLVDPTDATAVAEALAAALGSQGEELAQAGRARAAQFTWEHSAALHVEAYRHALGS